MLCCREIGLLLGAYQASRALANTLVALYGSPDSPGGIYPAMVAAGAGGYLLAAQLADAGPWGLLAFLGVGLSEALVPLQVGLRAEAAADAPLGAPAIPLIMTRLRAQYAAVAGGAAAAFALAGWLYHAAGFMAVCRLGIAVQVTQLLLGLAYLAAHSSGRHRASDPAAPLRALLYQLAALDVLQATGDGGAGGGGRLFDGPSLAAARSAAAGDVELRGALAAMHAAAAGSPGKPLSAGPLARLLGGRPSRARRALAALDVRGAGAAGRADFVSFLAPRVHAALQADSAGVRRGAATEGGGPRVFGYAYAVVASQAVVALGIGTFLSTSVLRYRLMGLDVHRAGLLLAAGEALGCAALLVSKPAPPGAADARARGRRQLSDAAAAVLSRPLHCVPALLAVGAATAAFGLPSPTVAVTAQLALSALNDLTVSLLNEATASAVRGRADYLRLQALGQLLRRCGNVLTALTGPWLFGAAPWLPWAVYGGAVAAWALGLWAVLWAQARRLAPTKERRGPLAAFTPFASRPWHAYETEYAERLASVEAEATDAELLPEPDAAAAVLWLRGELAELRVEVVELRRQLQAASPSGRPGEDVEGNARDKCSTERLNDGEQQPRGGGGAIFASLLYP